VDGKTVTLQDSVRVATESSNVGSVSTTGRVLDVVGIVLLLGGAGCYAWAYFGLERLRQHQPTLPHVLWVALAEYEHYARLSTIGVVCAGAGIAVSITAAVVSHRTVRARANATVP